jgi:hypothetical protein
MFCVQVARENRCGCGSKNIEHISLFSSCATQIRGEFYITNDESMVTYRYVDLKSLELLDF